MKKISCLLLLIATYTGFSQKAAPAITQYISMKGVIDKYPVTFHLHRINNRFSGNYYYDNTCLPISVNGVLDKTGFLKLTHASENEKKNETFQGPFKDSVFAGTWSYNGKLLSFRLSKKELSGLQFDYIATSGEKKLPVKPEYGPDGLSYDAATVWPSAVWHGPVADSIRRFIRDRFEEKNSTDEIGKILLRRKNAILNVKKDSIDEIETYSSSDVIQIEYIGTQLLSLSHSYYSYTGGAHGNYGTGYTCFNLSDGRQLQLYDVMDTLAAKPVMEKILEKKFRATYPGMIDEGGKLDEALFVEKIPMNDNFLLTAKGIAFNYVPYEIAAYAFGEIFLYIPFKEIDSLLKPEFKKLIQ